MVTRAEIFAAFVAFEMGAGHRCTVSATVQSVIAALTFVMSADKLDMIAILTRKVPTLEQEVVTRAEISAAIDARHVLTVNTGVVTADEYLVHTVNAGVVTASLKEVRAHGNILAALLTVLGIVYTAGGVIANANKDAAKLTRGMVTFLTDVMSAIEQRVISVLTGEVTAAVHAVLTVNAGVVTAIL